MAIAGPKGHLPFITLMNLHSIIDIGEIQLNESLSVAESIQQFSDEKYRILVFDDEVI